MTGKDLIIYILNNNLESTYMFDMDMLLEGLTDASGLAAKFNVGVATVRAWYDAELINGYRIGNTVLFLKSTEYPKVD